CALLRAVSSSGASSRSTQTSACSKSSRAKTKYSVNAQPPGTRRSLRGDGSDDTGSRNGEQFGPFLLVERRVGEYLGIGETHGAHHSQVPQGGILATTAVHFVRFLNGLGHVRSPPRSP